MFTSVINDRRSYYNCFDAARLYVLAAVNVGVFSAIYEKFSFGVVSLFMVFAFAVPLALGVLPWAVNAARPLPVTHAAPPAPSDEPDQINYVRNVKSLKFHRPDCQSVEDMKPKNRQDYAGSRDELIAVGYAPCKRCNP